MCLSPPPAPRLVPKVPSPSTSPTQELEAPSPCEWQWASSLCHQPHSWGGLRGRPSQGLPPSQSQRSDLFWVPQRAAGRRLVPALEHMNRGGDMFFSCLTVTCKLSNRTACINTVTFLGQEHLKILDFFIQSPRKKNANNVHYQDRPKTLQTSLITRRWGKFI